MKNTQYFVVDSNFEGDDMETYFEDSAKNFASGLQLGYLRAASVITDKVEGLTCDQKIAIYEIMRKTYFNVKQVTITKEEEEK